MTPAFFSARSTSGSDRVERSCTGRRAGASPAFRLRTLLASTSALSFTSGTTPAAADDRLRHRLGEPLRLHQRLAGGADLRRAAARRRRTNRPSGRSGRSGRRRAAPSRIRCCSATGRCADHRQAAASGAAPRVRALQAGLGEVGDLGGHGLGDDRRLVGARLGGCRARRRTRRRLRCRRREAPGRAAPSAAAAAARVEVDRRRRRRCRARSASAGALFWPQPLILFTKLISPSSSVRQQSAQPTIFRNRSLPASSTRLNSCQTRADASR